ncbi:carbohydrate binding domain-containing protein, partial [bacterium AH-315-I18]|nr:carbohydrate binding domain-containing protein [bacterium AH-315-I18]
MQKIVCTSIYSWLIVGLCSSMALAGEHLKNPDFSQGLTSWSFYVHKSMKVKRQATGGVLTLQIEAAGEPQNVQLNQQVALQEGTTYKLSFDAKRNGEPVDTQIHCMQQQKPYRSYGLNQTIEFSKTWSRHELLFTAKKLVAG